MPLLEIYEIKNMLTARKINITGCFHVGAHDCEELDAWYNNLGIKPEDVLWVDALPAKVSNASSRGIPNVFHSVITDKDDEDVGLNVANSTEYSSILELGTQIIEYPEVVFIDKLIQRSITIDTFFERNNVDASKYDFWKLNIRGGELLALKGATKSINNAKVIYLEVNSKELYKNGALITEIDEYLRRFNFKRMLTTMTIHKRGDAIYVLDNWRGQRYLVPRPEVHSTETRGT